MSEASDIETIKTCNRCGRICLLVDIQGKCRGHYICRNCFPMSIGDISDHPKNGQLASHSWINEKRVDLYSEMSHASEKMFPNPWLYIDLKKAEEIESPFTKSKNHISMKPINCPFQHCRKALAISGIPYHFAIDHKTTHQIQTRLEAKNGADLNLCEIEKDEIACIMLLHIIDENNQPILVRNPSDLQINSTNLAIKPVVLILCAKSEVLVPVPVKGKDEECSGEYFTTTDKINVWALSNVPLLLNYTICLTSIGKKRRMKYFGPISPLMDKTQPLFDESYGLVLGEDHVNFFSSQENCVLQVVLHAEDEHDTDEC